MEMTQPEGLYFTQWHVGNSADEFNPATCILLVKRVCIFYGYVPIEQFV
jgi:hypothetical protein